MNKTLNCLLSFKSENSGGRSMPMGDGFSPQFKFDNSFDLFFVKLSFEDEETVVFPGDQIKSKVLISSQNISDLPNLYAGFGFSIYEGDKIIGEGTIL